jgi:two-component system NtrC family sensor kinase
MSRRPRPHVDAHARAIYEAAPLGIGLCDRSLRFSFANRMLEQAFGYGESELRRLTLVDLAHPEDAATLVRLARELPEEPGQPTRSECRFVRRDGRVVWCRTSLSRLPGLPEEGDDPQMVVAVDDVSEQRRAEQKIRESERLVAVGTLSAGIAHEINNPVGSVLASAQYALMVMNEPGGAEKVAEALRNIEAEARRCGQIVKSVLKFAREETTERWPADLNLIVGQARDHSMEMMRRYGATLDLELAPDLPEVFVNPTEMEQLLANLIRNALQAGGLGIHVVVRTEARDDQVRLTVTDDGPGMPPEVREQIFDPFFTTREASGGTGLGLSMVHGIVSGHGGTISVHSEPGSGTEIRIELPAHVPGSGGGA